MADILKINIPWAVDGHSALDNSQAERSGKEIFRPGNKYVVDSSIREVYDSVALKQAIFDSGRNPDDFFRIGPYKSLLGRQIDEFDVVETANVTVDLESETLFTDVHLESSFLPARITGSIHLDRVIPEQLDLAIVINGTIQALMRRPTHGENTLTFSAVVPETAFRQGKNDVEVFVVSGSEDLPVLTGGESRKVPTYALSSSAEKEYLTTSDGRSIPVIPESVLGWVDNASINDSEKAIQLTGWAVDRKNNQLPETMIYFCNGKYVKSGRTTEPREDVARQFGAEGLRLSGFRMAVPMVWADTESNIDIRVFAISKDGVASELRYYEGYPWRNKP